MSKRFSAMIPKAYNAKRNKEAERFKAVERAPYNAKECYNAERYSGERDRPRVV